MKHIVLLLLLLSPITAEEISGYSFNRLDFEDRNEQLSPPIVLNHQFLNPSFDHSNFAKEQIKLTHVENELIIENKTTIYALGDPWPQTTHDEDEHLLSHLYLNSDSKTDVILSKFQKEFLADQAVFSKEQNL